VILLMLVLSKTNHMPFRVVLKKMLHKCKPYILTV
jgi:hypothetical protein